MFVSKAEVDVLWNNFDERFCKIHTKTPTKHDFSLKNLTSISLAHFTLLVSFYPPENILKFLDLFRDFRKIPMA